MKLAMLMICYFANTHEGAIQASTQEQDSLVEQAFAAFAADWATSELESVGSLLSPRSIHASVSSVSCGGSSIEIVDFKKQLLCSAERGDLVSVRKLLGSEKVSLNTRDGDGNTALMLATEHGHIAVVTAIIASRRANINIVNDAGETALMIAARKGDLELVTKILRVTSVNPDMVNDKQQTAAMIAREYGHDDIAAFLDARSARD